MNGKKNKKKKHDALPELGLILAKSTVRQTTKSGQRISVSSSEPSTGCTFIFFNCETIGGLLSMPIMSEYYVLTELSVIFKAVLGSLFHQLRLEWLVKTILN